MSQNSTRPNVADQIAKLGRETITLKAEVAAVRALLDAFIKGRNIHPPGYTWPPVDWQRGETRDTPEPRRPVEELERNMKATPAAEFTAKAILALARAQDGAFRDLRAMRADIEAIANDSDLRREFKSGPGKGAHP